MRKRVSLNNYINIIVRPYLTNENDIEAQSQLTSVHLRARFEIRYGTHPRHHGQRIEWDRPRGVGDSQGARPGKPY